MPNINLIPKDLSQTDDLAVSDSKDGLHYDNCPCCGTRDIEPIFKNNQGRGGNEIHDFSLYSCPNDGLSWDRTSRQGAEKNAAKGMNTKRLSGGATRLLTMPGLSRAYARNFDKIDQSVGKSGRWVQRGNRQVLVYDQED